MFLRIEITKPIKIITEKLLHIPRGFFSVTVRTLKGLEYQYQQCFKYKPGCNSNIQDKVDL
jgi:predicted metallopeptidase